MTSRVAAVATIRLVLTIVFTALVAVATMMLSTYVPQTRGYFNIGETMVYITALLFGPFVGAFAGGVGSMVADILLGYYVYAPATLIIKAAEGFVVGFLSQKAPQSGSKLQWVMFSIIMGGLAGLVLAFVGTVYYSGNIEFSLGFPLLGTATSTLFIPPAFWIGLAAVIVVLTGLAAYAFEARLGWMVLSILAGGVLMVTGYFLYQQLFLGYAAIVEVPFNIAQMMVGLIVAVPVVKAIWRSMPSLRDIRGKA